MLKNCLSDFREMIDFLMYWNELNHFFLFFLDLLVLASTTVYSFFGGEIFCWGCGETFAGFGYCLTATALIYSLGTTGFFGASTICFLGA